MCTVLLPPGDNPIAVNKYIISYENFMKIRPMGADLFHADGQTGMTKVTVAFRNLANAPKATKFRQFLLFPSSCLWGCERVWVSEWVCVCICIYIYIYIYGGARWRSGWGTTLQTGRSGVRFPMVSLEFFSDIILPVALWPWGRPSL